MLEVAKKAYREMEAKYGAPDGVTPMRMVWTNKAPFKEIILTKEAHQHDFPKPHLDCLEHVVEYEVPPEKASELIKSDGRLSFNRTAGTLSARCDSEAHNIGAATPEDRERLLAVAPKYGIEIKPVPSGGGK